MSQRQYFVPLQFMRLPRCGSNLPVPWLDSIVGRHTHSFDVPTEVVLLPGAKRNQAYMQQGRIWYADNALGTDCEHDDKGEIISQSCRFVVEVMENNGDDGHVEYVCVGYALVTSKMATEYVNAVNACERHYEFPAFEVEYCEYVTKQEQEGSVVLDRESWVQWCREEMMKPYNRC